MSSSATVLLMDVIISFARQLIFMAQTHKIYCQTSSLSVLVTSQDLLLLRKAKIITSCIIKSLISTDTLHLTELWLYYVKCTLNLELTMV